MRLSDHASVCAGALVKGEFNPSNATRLFQLNTPACCGCTTKATVNVVDGGCTPSDHDNVFDTTVAGGNEVMSVTLVGKVALSTSPVRVKAVELAMLIVTVMGSASADSTGACTMGALPVFSAIDTAACASIMP